MDCTCSAPRQAARRPSRADRAAPAPDAPTVSQYAVPGNLAERGCEAARPVAGRAQNRRATRGHGRAERGRCRPLWRPARGRFDDDLGRELARARFAGAGGAARHTGAARAAGRDRPCWPDA
ncbi:hypothetical protein D3273_12780 [Lichenibacterium minor]|uniref:Uncharacterized protein n=1 Tax=Lichenibacterium minor TaxID=2316528 RepID=A0A4Q2U9D6_9HYPH|nr:hypothetical protein [Lichenibacterium minor]RYC31515.1 hypothetical protein D3273_12780 [Lichenibacterium minor]